MSVTVSLNQGFSLILDDPNAVLGANYNNFVKDMNYVVNVLTSYISFSAPLTFAVNVRPSSQNPYGNTDGLMPATGVTWATSKGQTTLASIVKGQTGVDPNGSSAEAGFTFYVANDGTLKNYGSSFWFDPNPIMGTPPNIPNGQTDFAGVALHETLHCLGFATFAAANAPWNQHIITQNGVRYYSSSAVTAILGGNLPIAPDANDPSFVSDHVGNTNIVYQPIKSDLMYQWGNYSGNRLEIGQLDLLILKDLGWSIKNYQSLPLTDPIDYANVSGTANDDFLKASGLMLT